TSPLTRVVADQITLLQREKHANTKRSRLPLRSFFVTDDDLIARAERRLERKLQIPWEALQRRKPVNLARLLRHSPSTSRVPFVPISSANPVWRQYFPQPHVALQGLTSLHVRSDSRRFPFRQCPLEGVGRIPRRRSRCPTSISSPRATRHAEPHQQSNN